MRTKPRLIIVEGPDSTGKSSLSKFLARETKSVYVHASGHKSLHDEMLHYHGTLLKDAEFNLQNGLNVVMDRHWPSEWCYGRILRPQLAERYGFNLMRDQLVALEPIYIFCSSDKSFERQWELHATQDHRYDKASYERICDEYRKLHLQMLDFTVPGQTVLEYSIEKHGHDLRGFTQFVMNL